MSIPMWACGPVSGEAVPILTDAASIGFGASAFGAGASSFLPQPASAAVTAIASAAEMTCLRFMAPPCFIRRLLERQHPVDERLDVFVFHVGVGRHRNIAPDAFTAGFDLREELG